MPEAKTRAADTVSRLAEAWSSLTQQFINQPKKLIGSCGISSRKIALWRYINGMKVVF
jgi:hypothetical protein